MKPLKMIMSAFGPYASETVIDFRLLGDKGLYLICGDTGAGKTTIFDALCFALYGEASGDNRKSEMFRSKYADAHTATYVELFFLCKQKEYRIKRIPKYERPKERGEGMTKQQEAAELFCPDGTIVTKVSEVTKKVIEILGLTREQFGQIAMIAQGDFLKLLLAGTEERMKIFRQIFHTGKYEQLQMQINQDFRNLWKECDDLRKRILQYAESTYCFESNPLYENWCGAKEGKLLTADLISLLEKLLAEDMEKEQDCLEKLERNEKEIHSVVIAIEQLKKGKQQKKLLEAKKEIFQGMKEEVVAAHAKLEEAKEGQTQIDSLGKEILFLKDKMPQYDKLQESQENVKKLGEEVKYEEKMIEKLKLSRIEREDILEKEKEKLLLLEKKEKEVLEAASMLEEVENVFTTLVKALEAIKQYDALKGEYERRRKVYVSSREALEQQRKNFFSLEQLFMDGQAGILSMTLKEGMPCPVCGSINHPQKAELPQNAPSREEWQQAKKELEKEEKKMQDIHAKTSLAYGQWEEKKTQIFSLAREFEVEEDKEILESYVKKEGKIVQEKRLELKQLYGKLSRQMEGLKKAKEEFPQKESMLKRLLDEIYEKEKNLAVRKERLESFVKKEAEIRKELTFTTKEEAVFSLGELTKKQKHLMMVLENASNEYQKMVQQLSLLEGEIKSLEEQTMEVDEERLKSLFKIQEEKEVEKARLTGERERFSMARIKNSHALEKIKENDGKLSKKEADYGWMKALNDTVNGRQNEKGKIMLETYVQMAYFESILEKANIRLESMTQGQYTLIRKKESTDNRSQTGLDLEVMDHYNGSVRHVKTLSGGESFMASLSLALGLADEITASAGGVRVETMFVDEGFGTLDEETLSQAMKVLAGLSEGNRLVGIISHVEELKRKIPAQIIVTKNKVGFSKAEII